MLFSLNDLCITEAASQEQRKASAQRFAAATAFAGETEYNKIAEVIGTLSPGEASCFVTRGAWSNISVLEHVLAITGPANVYFTTWSISADAITRLATWQEQGLIKHLQVLIDSGLNNRKPELYQLAKGSFAHMRTTQIHGKIAVVANDQHAYTITGSANFTENKRIETGVIINSRGVADFNIGWIKEVYDGMH